MQHTIVEVGAWAPIPDALDLLDREVSAMNGFLSSLADLPDDESRRRVLNHVSAATAPLFEPV